MSLYAVPFHLDERLNNLNPPVPAKPIAPSLPDGAAWVRLAALYEVVADAVQHDDERPVVLSGDCTTSLGILAGLQRRGLDPAVVWFDAHGDLNTPDTSPSGYLGGMPFALALGHGERAVLRRLGLRRILPEQALLVDARDLDPGERELIAAASLRHVPVTEMSSWLVPEGPVYLHVDLDVLDPGEVPGLRYPAPGGPSLGTLIDALRAVVSTGRIAAVGIGVTCHDDQLGDLRVHDTLAAVLAALET